MVVTVWLVLAGLLLIGEIITVGFILLWFSIGAVVASIAAKMGMDFYLQVIVFSAVSIGLLVFTRPIVKRLWKHKEVATNVSSIIGKKGMVVQGINNILGQGQVKIGGEVWSARSEDESEISLDEQIEVAGVEGVKLIVRKIKNKEGQV
jgi:membrane protein implicated in regulation of membrane protease activity